MLYTPLSEFRDLERIADALVYSLSLSETKPAPLSVTPVTPESKVSQSFYICAYIEKFEKWCHSCHPDCSRWHSKYTYFILLRSFIALLHPLKNCVFSAILLMIQSEGISNTDHPSSGVLSSEQC
jgi:hypothetical protein